jgi:hypothetical protein
MELNQQQEYEYVPLYYQKPNKNSSNPLPTYYCARGTNKVENYFSKFHSCLPGTNNGVEYATTITGLFNLRQVTLASFHHHLPI